MKSINIIVIMNVNRKLLLLILHGVLMEFVTFLYQIRVFDLNEELGI